MARLWMCIGYLITASMTIAALTMLDVMYAAVWSYTWGFDYFGPEEAQRDVQWILICLLIHDKFVHVLTKNFFSRKTNTETYEHDC